MAFVLNGAEDLGFCAIIPTENLHPYLHCTHQIYTTDCHPNSNIWRIREVPASIISFLHCGELTTVRPGGPRSPAIGLRYNRNQLRLAGWRCGLTYAALHLP